MEKEVNILIVEDNDIDVEMLKRSLKKIGAGNALLRARDGLEALQILQGELTDDTLDRPFVILLDINMPRMNGHEFLEKLRATDGIKDARVFVFTTSDSEKDVALAYERNANGYIVKPRSSSELNDIVTTLRKFWAICESPPDRVIC